METTTSPDNYQDRVRLEAEQLKEKITKLEAYLEPLDMTRPQPFEIRALDTQLTVMKQYHFILLERIHNFH